MAKWHVRGLASTVQVIEAEKVSVQGDGKFISLLGPAGSIVAVIAMGQGVSVIRSENEGVAGE